MIRLQAGLLLASLALVNSTAAEPRSVAMDARETAIESPQPLLAAHALAQVAGPAPGPTAAFGPAPPTYPAVRGACERFASDLCFDSAGKRIVFRAASQYMPALDGFAAEGISLHRHAVVFKYTFK
jgi:hypothetical protein